MQLLKIYDYYGEDIGTYLIEESLTNKEIEELENALIKAQEEADPSDIDVVEQALMKWLDEHNLHTMSYRFDEIYMTFKEWI